MMSNTFEAAYSDFLDQRECEAASEALFQLIRGAFLAGWLAAGGTPPQREKFLEVLRPTDTQ